MSRALSEDRRVDFNPTVRKNNGSEHVRTPSAARRDSMDDHGQPRTRRERFSDMTVTLANERAFARFKPLFDAWLAEFNPHLKGLAR